MKTKLTAIVAILALMGTAMVATITLTSNAAAQDQFPTRILTLRNSETASVPADPADSVVVTLKTRSSCHNTGGSLAGTAAATNSGRDANETTITIQAGKDFIAGALSTACLWELTYTSGNGNCQVNAYPNADSTFAADLSNTGNPNSMMLYGNLKNLNYNGVTAEAVRFDITDTCASLIEDAEVAITVPNATDYAGFEFEVSIAKSSGPATGCSKASKMTLTVPRGRATVSEDLNLVQLPLGATTECTYAVTFEPEVKSLEAVTTFKDPVEAERTGYDNLISKTGPLGADPEAQATYRKIQIDVIVTMKFPDSSEFRTTEKVEYHVRTKSPCGGYIEAVPVQFGSQGRVVTRQAFEGTQVVYGPSISRIEIGDSPVTIDAYADVDGTKPCSVTVQEKETPAGCALVGDNPRTVKYAQGGTFTFEFDHTCGDAVSTRDTNDQTLDSGETPPTPPVPGAETTSKDGPPRPAFTG